MTTYSGDPKIDSGEDSTWQFLFHNPKMDWDILSLISLILPSMSENRKEKTAEEFH